ncbi:unnamed protein product [Didymodactylos carnosus]|uniref:Uncharacterized protein n=1 Tax=Didymodactylos carnosus TaxID=1234261 RepID=A0A816A8K9_9BILA|nr:unnamed protein product [Didymodactylos carnosus]CAF4465930.1 unnamed protein product [Didymodactylos carnosus]
MARVQFYLVGLCLLLMAIMTVNGSTTLNKRGLQPVSPTGGSSSTRSPHFIEYMNEPASPSTCHGTTPCQIQLIIKDYQKSEVRSLDEVMKNFVKAGEPATYDSDLRDCREKAKTIKAKTRTIPLSVDEIAIIMCYTKAGLLHEAVNKALRSGDTEKLAPFAGYVNLLHLALKKLQFLKTTVYRGE